MTTQIAVYAPFRAQLAELKAHNDTMVFDYEDPAGNKDARSHIHKLRMAKGAVESARKTEKAVSLEYGRQVDAQAREITDALDTMIAVHRAPLDVIEQREESRKSAHQERIERMRNLAAESNEDTTAAEFRRRLDELESYLLGDHWQEFELEAARAKEAGVSALRQQIERR